MAGNEGKYIGTGRIGQLIYTNKKEIPIQLVQKALDAQEEIVKLLAGMRIVSQALQHAKMTKSTVVMDQMTELALDGSEESIGKIYEMDASLVPRVARMTPGPKLLPVSMVDSLKEKLSALNDLLKQLKMDEVSENAVPDLAKFDENLYQGDMSFLKDLGADGGEINDIHQKLIKMLDAAKEGGSVRISRRMLISGQLAEDPRIKAFAEQWGKVHAEEIIDNTSGSGTSGISVTQTDKGLDWQIQVGAVAGHAMVLADDGQTLSLSYWDGCSGRRSFLRLLLKKVGVEPDLAGGSVVTGTGKSSPKLYESLAKIIPNLIDMDFVDGFSDNRVVQSAAIEAILAGYPATLLRDKRLATFQQYSRICYGASVAQVMKRSGNAAASQGSAVAQAKASNDVIRAFKDKGMAAMTSKPVLGEMSKLIGQDEAKEFLKFSKKAGLGTEEEE